MKILEKNEKESQKKGPEISKKQIARLQQIQEGNG